MMNRITIKQYHEIKNKPFNVYWFNRKTLIRETGILNCDIITAMEEILKGQEKGFYTILVTEEKAEEVENIETPERLLREERMTYEEVLKVLNS